MLKTILIIFLLCLPLMAQTIYLKDGTIYKNVKILEQHPDYLQIKVNNSIATLETKNIIKIDSIKYNPDLESQIIRTEIQKPVVEVQKNKPDIKYYRPYKHLLWVSLLSAAVAWDSFTEVSNLNTTIDTFNKYKLDTGGLESEKSRKTYVGVAAAVVTVALAIISFKEVEVKPNDNGLALSYRF